MADITVTQTKSAIGTKPKHRGTLRALGLGRIGQTNTLPDRPEIRGMIARVPHLIAIGDDVDGPQGSDKANESGEAVDTAVAEVVEEVAADKADDPVPFAGDDSDDTAVEKES
ncbi:50S ribosomal protein L30 [Ilumatobacter nonamiensis]|uniref:50S ribosomal protein L30 n=1 Tax=Ilumatobacter nonamiensis TaxID=467093 RepID=UPI00034D9862